MVETKRRRSHCSSLNGNWSAIIIWDGTEPGETKRHQQRQREDTCIHVHMRRRASWLMQEEAHSWPWLWLSIWVRMYGCLWKGSMTTQEFLVLQLFLLTCPQECQLFSWLSSFAHAIPYLWKALPQMPPALPPHLLWEFTRMASAPSGLP